MSDQTPEVEEQKVKPIIGIDLGTSTSSIACLDEEGRPYLLRDAQNDAVIPSVVQFTPEGNFLVGTSAKASAVTFHDRTVQEVKRLMGTHVPVKLGDRTLTPEEVSAIILRHLKEAAEARLGVPVTDVVLSVPARFENEAREATRRAAEMAGLHVVRLINEPTAAALSYGLDRLADQQKILVFDFGGGTLDVTVLEMFEGILDVKTSVGDDKLGGKDIDEALIKIFRDAYQEQKGKKLPPPSRDRKIAQMLKEEAEGYKKLLSESLNVPVEIPYLTPEGGISMRLSRDTLEESLESMLMRAMVLVNEALSRARLRWEDIDVVLPVGGSSRMPLFRRALGFAWGREIKSLENPDEAVAKGAAIAAGIERRAFENANAEKDIVILDVSPHRLGVATIKQVGSGQFINDYFSEIIPKDTKLPATQRREYHTAFHGSQPISVRIYEASGDSNLCRDHHLVAELPLRNLYATSEGEPVQVEFRYTLDGTLDVSIQYVAAPLVKTEGRFTVLGGNYGTDPSASSVKGNGAVENGGAGGLLAESERARWQDAPQADMCAPLLEQAERLEKEAPENAAVLRSASDAVKAALISNDDSEIRRLLDALTDLLFEMA